MSKFFRYSLAILLVCFFSASVTLAAEPAKTQTQTKGGEQTQTKEQKKDGSCSELTSNQHIGFELAASKTRTRTQTQTSEQEPNGDPDPVQKQDRTCQS